MSSENDPFGRILSEDEGMLPHLPPPSYPVAFEEQWFSNLEAADYVVLAAPLSDYSPMGKHHGKLVQAELQVGREFTYPFPQPPPIVLGIVQTTSLYSLRASQYVYENISRLRILGGT